MLLNELPNNPAKETNSYPTAKMRKLRLRGQSRASMGVQLGPASWLEGDPVRGEEAGRGAAASKQAQPDPLDSFKY